MRLVLLTRFHKSLSSFGILEKDFGKIFIQTEKTYMEDRINLRDMRTNLSTWEVREHMVVELKRKECSQI